MSLIEKQPFTRLLESGPVEVKGRSLNQIGRSLSASSDLVFNPEEGSYLLTSDNVVVILTHKYLQDVLRLDPKRRGDHIVEIARKIREANHIVFIKPPVNTGVLK